MELESHKVWLLRRKGKGCCGRWELKDGNVYLFNDSIRFISSPDRELQVFINMDDVIGVKVFQGPHPQMRNLEKDSVLLKIYAYALKKDVRTKVPLDLNFKEKSTAESFRERILQIIRPDPLPNPIYVLINPNSGSGKALKMFKSKVAPIWEEAELQFVLKLTEYPNHARQLAYKLDLSKWSGLVVVSGDGLFFEILNGLLQRQDREQALQLPMSIIPGGSGNALAAALCWQSKEPFKATDFSRNIALMVCRPTLRPMKVVHVETPTHGSMGSFISVNWGLLADIDIESEKYRRSLGQNRFILTSIIRLIGLRTYRLRVSYLNGVEAPSGVGNQAVPVQGGKANQVELRSVDSFQLPEITEPVPATWKMLEDNFTLVTVMYLSHMAGDLPLLPQSRLDDDQMYLIYVRSADAGRCRLFQMMLSFESQQHLNSSFFKIIPVDAVRIEALDGPNFAKGKMVVDGELLPNCRCAQMTNTRLRAMLLGK